MIASGLVRAVPKAHISSGKTEVCNQVGEELSTYGTCIALPADLSTVEGVLELAQAVSEREQQVEILVNNAGATWGAPRLEYPDEAWDKVLAANLKAVFSLTTEPAPWLKHSARGDDPARVINSGSVDGIRVPETENDAYSATCTPATEFTYHRQRHRPRPVPFKDAGLYS